MCTGDTQETPLACSITSSCIIFSISGLSLDSKGAGTGRHGGTHLYLGTSAVQPSSFAEFCVARGRILCAMRM